jgi:hypothetical protein
MFSEVLRRQAETVEGAPVRQRQKAQETKEVTFEGALGKLAKYGGFSFLESCVDGIRNLNPERKARKKIFMTDTTKGGERGDLEKPDDVVDMFFTANHTGGDPFRSNTCMACNRLVGRARYVNLEEADDLHVSPGAALAGKVYYTLMSQVTAGSSTTTGNPCTNSRPEKAGAAVSKVTGAPPSMPGPDCFTPFAMTSKPVIARSEATKQSSPSRHRQADRPSNPVFRVPDRRSAGLLRLLLLYIILITFKK